MNLPDECNPGERTSTKQWLRLAAALSILAMLLRAWPASAALQTGAYQTAPGATVVERGDAVPGGSRVVPFFATLVFDLSAPTHSLTAVIANAVVEGGEPFTLSVRSSSSALLVDGTYRYSGDYLREIYPARTQYAFDWRFSASTNGSIRWNGVNAWTGGHAWYVDISDIALVPVPWLDIFRLETGALQIQWATNFYGYILESAPGLPALEWSTLTNAVVIIGDRFSVTMEMPVSRQFFRLRKPSAYGGS